MIRYPKWYDVYTDQLCEIETILDQTEAELRAYNEDRLGWNAQHIRLWKRHHFRTFFGAYGPVRFRTTSPTQPTMIWANRATSQTQSTRVEDGFIRSRGVGADLIPPLSLVTDKSGIYYDPTAPSDLENLISQGPALRQDQQVRIE